MANQFANVQRIFRNETSAEVAALLDDLMFGISLSSKELVCKLDGSTYYTAPLGEGASYQAKKIVNGVAKVEVNDDGSITAVMASGKKFTTTNTIADYNADAEGNIIVSKAMLEEVIQNIDGYKPIYKGYDDPYTMNASSWDAGTRTITLSSSTGSVTLTSQDNQFTYANGNPALSHQIPAVRGYYYLYWDASGQLFHSNALTADDVRNYCLGPMVYLDGTNELSIIERWEHARANEIENEASYFTKGLQRTDQRVLLDGSIGGTQTGYTAGTWYTARDHRFTSPAVSATAKHWPIFYYGPGKDSFGEYTLNRFISPAPTGRPFIRGTDIGLGFSNLVYNLYNSGTDSWSPAQVASSDYVCMFYIAAQGALAYITAVIGQKTYNNIGEAILGIAEEAKNLVTNNAVFKDAGIFAASIHKGDTGAFQDINGSAFYYPEQIGTGSGAPTPSTPPIYSVLSTGEDAGGLGIKNARAAVDAGDYTRKDQVLLRDGSQDMTGVLTLWDQASVSGKVADLGKGYGWYTDNAGTGTSGTRMWMDTPNGSEVVIGPRAGVSFIDHMRFKANYIGITDINGDKWTFGNNGVVLAHQATIADIEANVKALTTHEYTDAKYIPLTQKGAANGVAELGSDGRVPASQLPAYVDDVLEFATLSSFPATGETGKIYVALDTNKTYRWGGSSYVEISPSLALGETSATAYRGDRGAIAYAHSQDGTIHLTSVQKTDLTDGGDSTLHFHQSDRDWASGQFFPVGGFNGATGSDFNGETLFPSVANEYRRHRMGYGPANKPGSAFWWWCEVFTVNTGSTYYYKQVAHDIVGNEFTRYVTKTNDILSFPDAWEQTATRGWASGQFLSLSGGTLYSGTTTPILRLYGDDPTGNRISLVSNNSLGFASVYNWNETAAEARPLLLGNSTDITKGLLIDPAKDGLCTVGASIADIDANAKALTTHEYTDAKYAPISHTQAISTVTGLQTALDGKVSLTGDQSIAGVKTFNGDGTSDGLSILLGSGRWIAGDLGDDSIHLTGNRLSKWAPGFHVSSGAAVSVRGSAILFTDTDGYIPSNGVILTPPTAPGGEWSLGSGVSEVKMSEVDSRFGHDTNNKFHYTNNTSAGIYCNAARFYIESGGSYIMDSLPIGLPAGKTDAGALRVTTDGQLYIQP